MLVYKMDVLEELKKIGINQYWLYQHPDCGVSQSAVAKLRQGTIVGIKTLDALCGLLRCQPGDLIAWKEPGE